ncbi:MAG: 1-acyl-sn-glycerol-3-phosphate acyltransferase [Demequinaceae bacterium]|nr:1-acyl-sn-glycerol-3-phosphate acyltransferase [Demequinaceae bacterium]
MYYQVFKYVLLGPGLKMVYRPWAEGLDNIPDKGPAILASNHLSFSDSIFLPLVMTRKLVFLGKADYFNGRGLKGAATRAFMAGVGTIPVNRGGGRASEAALRTGLQVLANGDLLGIYPEGTRSPDGRLYKGKTGVARLAIESGVPVIPVAMIDTHIAQPIGKRIPTRHQTGVKVGEPLDFSDYAGRQEDREALREVTDTVMAAIQDLSGQEYVDRDGVQYKKELDRELKGEWEGELGD